MSKSVINNNVSAAILGCGGERLSQEEKAFFADVNPFGFILFQRNCTSKDQIKSLINDLKESVGRDDVDILIDQEGGRVARLKPPVWDKYPSALSFSDMIEREGLAAVREALYANYVLLASELTEVGVTVNCAPVVDLLFEDTHDVIGDRSFGSNPNIVAELASVVCQALQDHHIMPIIKHIPGHGRARVDSHLDLPTVTASIEEMRSTDFAAFTKVKDAPWAMTAHIIYTALDTENTATTSRAVIDYIRNDIGFKGVLITDDLSMKALQGSFAERTEKSLEAGCDLVLHCNGDMDEMKQIASVIPQISSEAHKRITHARSLLKSAINFDYTRLRSDRDVVLNKNTIESCV